MSCSARLATRLRPYWAGEARAVILARTYSTGLEDLWDACTNPERIPRWFLPVSGELRVGGRFQLEGNASGTIERCEPPTGFRATWELGLSGLGLHLAGENWPDPAAAQAWSASEEGRRFITESSDHWSETAVAAGTDTGTARDWAARTTAFYTGTPQPD